MSKVEVVCAGFSGSFAKVNGSRQIPVSHLEMTLAIATVGMQSFWSFSDWQIRLSRLLTATAMCLYLEEQKEGLCVSNNFDKIDTSEKGIAGYWLGMGFAKIVAAAVLDIQCLQDVDNLIRQGSVEIAPQIKRRGDLVGLGRRGDWHAIEAKGRSTTQAFKSTHKLVVAAKKQSVNILSVFGTAPVTNSACLTALRSRPISVFLCDPPTDEIEYLEMSASNFYRRYYEGIIETISFLGSRREYVNGRAFRIARISIRAGSGADPRHCDWHLGLLEEIFDSPERAGEFFDELVLRKDYVVGRDGVLLALGRHMFNLHHAEPLE